MNGLPQIGPKLDVMRQVQEVGHVIAIESRPSIRAQSVLRQLDLDLDLYKP